MRSRKRGKVHNWNGIHKKTSVRNWEEYLGNGRKFCVVVWGKRQSRLVDWRPYLPYKELGTEIYWQMSVNESEVGI